MITSGSIPGADQSSTIFIELPTLSKRTTLHEIHPGYDELPSDLYDAARLIEGVRVLTRTILVKRGYRLSGIIREAAEVTELERRGVVAVISFNLVKERDEVSGVNVMAIPPSSTWQNVKTITADGGDLTLGGFSRGPQEVRVAESKKRFYSRWFDDSVIQPGYFTISREQ